MRKRIALGLALVVAIGLAIAFALPVSNFVLLGGLHGEAFYAGRPPSYWASALKRDPFVSDSAPPDVGKTLREGGEKALPVLRELLHNDDEQVRSEALLALSVLPVDSAARAPILADLLSEDIKDWQFFLRALARLQAGDRQDTITGLTKALQLNPNPRSRFELALVLADLKPHAELAIPLLEEAMDNKQATANRVRAARAYWRTTGQAERTIGVLMEAVAAGDFSAYEVLREMGPDARSAVPALIQIAKEGNGKNPMTRDQAVQVLGHLGSEARPAVPLLAGMLKEDFPRLNYTVVYALSEIGPAAKEAVPALRQLYVGQTALGATRIVVAPDGPASTLPALSLVLVWEVGPLDNRYPLGEALKKIDPASAKTVGF
jgi:HEAT repeat protein